jgi:glycosyltransferase involved in cell wall biosynthesis
MHRPVTVLELRSVRGTGGGPEKTILQGAARSDPARIRVIVCYLRDRRDQVFAIDTKAAALPIEYEEVWERNSFDPAVWPQLRELVRRRQPDIVHSHDYKTNLLAYLLAKAHDVVPLSTVHGWTGHTPRERYLYYPVDRRVLARFPRLIAVSSEIKSVLVANGAAQDKVAVVLNGIDHERFRRDSLREDQVRREFGYSSDEQIVGSIGRLEPQKRYDLLIEVIRRLLETRPRLRLVIAGDGSLREPLAAQAARMLPSHAYRFLGHDNDVVRLHHGFNCYVQSSDYEGTSNSILEAMALSTPIVATDVGGTSELVRHGREGLIVGAGRAEPIGAAIAAVFDDPTAAAGRAAAARTRVEHELSFEHRMAQVEEIYEALAGKRQQ